MAEKYFALELVGGIGLSKTHQNCEGITTVYVCSAQEHAENEQLRARIQELGQMVREVNTKRVVELQVEMQRIVTEHETAMTTLRQIAARSRKTREQRLAHATVTFLDSLNESALKQAKDQKCLG